MELRALLEVLWRRKQIIFAVFLSIFLTIMIGTVLVMPWHDATAKILLRKSSVASSILASLGLQGQASSSAALSDTDRADYLALAKLRPVAEKVIADHGLKRIRTRARIIKSLPFMKPILSALGVDVSSTEETIKGEDLVNRDIMSYIFARPYIYVDQYESTDIITMEGMSTDPEEASRIANAMAEAFVEEELKRVREDFKGAKEYIQHNIQKYNNEYTQALLALKKFKEREKSLNLDSETAEFMKEISDLKQSQRDLYIQLAQTRTKFSPDHPAVKDFENEIEQTKQLIQQKMEKVFGPQNLKADPALRELNGMATGMPDLAAANARMSGVQQDSGRKFDDETLVARLPQKSFEYTQLSLKVSVTQDIYNSLLKALYQVGIAEAISVSGIYVAEPAFTPLKNDGKHRHPQGLFNFAIALLLGVVFSLGAALTVEYLDDTLRNPDDIKSFKGLTFLGTILKLRRKNSRIIDTTDPRSPLREVFRNIRSNIRFATLDKPLKSFTVTSSMQGEGKSFFAVNIALALASEGKKVLLIDGDMRRPNIHAYFKVSNAVGLTNYLVGDRDLESIQMKPSIDGLTIIPTGPIPPDPAKLAESKKMQQLVKTMEERFDMVIVDSPPVFAATDAVYLAGYTGEVLIIIESGKASRKHFPDVIEMFSKAGINILGVVLNKASGENISYYYRYQYEYKTK